jgi:RHS repeat-associated protein
VNGPPAVLYVTPNFAKPGQTVTVTIVGTFTHFQQGVSQANFGAGISVGGGTVGAAGPITVTSATSATAQLTILASATLGLRAPITVTTGAESASWTSPGFFVLGTVTGPFPVVAITSPTEGSEVTNVTTVTGTATSPNLAFWTLSYQGSGSTVFTQFASGTGPAVTGSFDPTLLLNGMAQIQLSATDQSGQVSTTSVNVVVTRNVKIGNFTVTFNDLSIPVAGIPIQILRTYDSRNKSVGDFGFGWSLSIKTTKVDVNAVLGNNWSATVSNDFLPNYCVQPPPSDVVSVRLQDGTVYEFAPTVTPATQCLQLQPPLSVDIAFTPIGSTPAKATLTAPGGSGLLPLGAFPGPIQLVDSNTFLAFDPDQFILTVPTGQQLQISRTFGVQSIKDTNGNTLTINANGITSSTGKGVVFVRDAQNRITTITDPNGNKLNYAYDSNGDLVSFTDQLNNVSSFTYDRAHDLLSFKDPRGVQPIRNVYDDSGRLSQIIDPFGHVTNLSHDFAGNAETVVDFLGNPTTFVYDNAGNLIQKIDALGGITKKTFDAHGNKLSETNALGKTTTSSYDGNNNLLTQTDPLGHTITLTYNSSDKLLTFTDPNGKTVANTFDASGNLLTLTNALGKSSSHTYDSAGNSITVTDFNGNSTSLTYDGPGNLTSQKDATGTTASYTYDANGNRLAQSVTRTTKAGPQILTTQYQYDAMNRVVQTILPDGSNTQTTYNAIGKKATTTDALGRQTTYSYDDAGRLTQKRFPDGTSESNQYDANGQVTQFTARNGSTNRYVYDALGRPVSSTDSQGGTTFTSFDALGQTISITDARGNVTHSTYDDAGRRISRTDANGGTTTFAYDAAGRPISQTDANGHTSTFQFDSAGHRTQVTFADGSFETTTYDALGHTLSRQDAAGKTTQFGNDALGRLTSVTDAIGKITHYGYDEIGDLISQTDANNRKTSFGYDQLGRIVSRTLPLGQTETFAYDLSGNLTSHSDFNGKTTTYSYDAVNRLTTKTPDPSFHQAAVTYTYTATGNRASMTDATGITNYVYDQLDRLIVKKTPQGTMNYAYDSVGNITQVQAGTFTVNYGYDSLNRPFSVAEAATGTANYTYDAVGNLQGVTYPSGITHTYNYDSRNRLTALALNRGATQLRGYTYVLDAAGHRLSVAESPGRTVNYGYDNIYRLISEVIAGDTGGQNGSLGYSYDAVGNRLQTTSTVPAIPAGLLSYDDNDRLTSAPYDANGNALISGGLNNTYDFENRLIQHGNVTMVYDGDGNRVSKTVGGITTRYLVDDHNVTGFPQVFIESSSDGSSRKYVYGLERISQTRFNAITNTTQISFYLYDGQSSVRELADAIGAITDTYDYDAYGNLIHSTGSTPNNYLYSGEQFDSDLGLYFLRARYLDVSTGRFLTMDPLMGSPQDPLSLHRYLYAHDDPANRIDPSGMQDDLISLAITASIAGFLAGGVLGGISCGWRCAAQGATFGGIAGFLLPFVAAAVVAGLVWVGFASTTAMFISLSTFTFVAGLLGLRSYEQATTTRAKIAAVLGIVLALAFFGLGIYRINNPPVVEPTSVPTPTVNVFAHGTAKQVPWTAAEGNTITFVAGLGDSITNRLAVAIINGDDLTPFSDQMEGAFSVLPGSPVPFDVELGPLGDVTLPRQGDYFDVNSPTMLSTLGEIPNQGHIVVVACCLVKP